ncbi:hypothetical protein ACHAXT_006166 [Thalassiosira profunda]
MSYEESHLSAGALLAASPTHSGTTMKMHVPAMFTFLPATIQWFLATFCPQGWSPQWKKRHLIALGEYLYRFKNEDSASPKGAPIPVATAEARIISREECSDELGMLFVHLPEGCEGVFEVSSIGKTQYFAVESREEATLWVNSLRQMQQDAITRNMGHAKGVPYPQNWKAFDASAKRLKDQKTRIKSKMEALDRKEKEMQAGGSAGLGYFG